MPLKESLRINSTSRRVPFLAFLLAVTLLPAPLTVAALDLISTAGPSSYNSDSASGDSILEVVSANGRYVLFSSSAKDLATQSNGVPYSWAYHPTMNVYLRDRVLKTTTLVSVDMSGTTGADNDCFPTGISTNGQYALFESAASNLVSGFSNLTSQKNVFVRDLIGQSTTVVTIGTNSSDADGDSSDSVMTADGRYVAFSSFADNLVENDTNGIGDVFIRDMQTGVTKLVSVGAQATQLALHYGVDPSASSAPSVTPDGRYVVFTSTASNLVANVTNVGDIYARDLVQGKTFWVSTNAHKSLSGDIFSYNPRISDDGNVVSYLASLRLSDTPSIFRHHLQTGTDEVLLRAIPSTSSFDDGWMDMSADGRFLAFVAKSNSFGPLLVWDTQTSSFSMASIDTNGNPVTSGFCSSVRIDSTGRYVSFFSTTMGLTTNSILPVTTHLYWRDLRSGINKLVDVGAGGDALNRTPLEDFDMSADGSVVLYDSIDSDIVTNDNNGSWDVFARAPAADVTDLISMHDPDLGVQVPGRTSRIPSISRDGQYAAFCYTGAGVLSDYTNRYRGVFVRDLINQSNFLVSVDTNGLNKADGTSTEPSISGNGRYVVFTSFADNLVLKDTNHASDVFIRDLQAGTTKLVSANTNNTGSMFGSSFKPCISFDGHYVLFFNQSNIVFRDCVLNTNYFLGSNGTAAAMTPDGRYVTFCGSIVSPSQAIFVWDSQVRQRVFTNNLNGILNLSISTNGQWVAAVTPAGGVSMSDRLSNSNRNIITVSRPVCPRPGIRFSGDASALVYATVSAKVPADTNNSQDVYIYDWQANTNVLVSHSYYIPQAAMGNSDNPDISADGRYVIYESGAPDIVPSDSNLLKDVFLFDRQSGMTTLLSASTNGQGTGNYQSETPAFTGDGFTVAFQSWASDLVENNTGRDANLFALRIVSTNSSGGLTNPPVAVPGELIFVSGGAASSSGQSPRLVWAAVPGTAYQVQYKDNLTDPDWQPLQGSAVVVGAQGSVVDLAPNPDHRFYRIIPY